MDLQKLFSWVNEKLGWGEYTRPRPTQVRSERTLLDLWNELVGIIPYSDYLFWFLEQYAINPDMQLLIKRQDHSYFNIDIIYILIRLQEPSTEYIRDELNQCQEYLDYRCWFIGEGIDLVSLEEKGCTFLEWTDCNSPECP